MNKAQLLLMLLVVLWLPSANTKLKRVKITDGVSALLPSEFMKMTDDDLATKYPSAKKPLAMFTDPYRLVDFGLNVSTSRWRGSDLKLLQEVYKSTIMEMYSKVELLQEGVKTIRKREYIVFEFTSVFEGIKNYNYLQYAVVKDQVFLFNFTCPANLKEQWQPVAGKIMESVRMNISKPIELQPVVKKGVKKYVPKKTPTKTK
jgi:hypothetical protein